MRAPEDAKNTGRSFITPLGFFFLKNGTQKWRQRALDQILEMACGWLIRVSNECAQ